MAKLFPAASLALAIAAPALAGPPFLTDDPEPTDAGHWEIYAPLVEASGRGADYEGAVGAEINYGAAPDVQVTVGLPVAYTHDAGGLRAGAGDFEASVKYRFYHDEDRGVQIAFFPGLSVPTASRGFGADRVTALLPVWAQQDFGRWSVFGGGGYAINPGAGNRDFWTGGVAVTRQVGERGLIGLEADREGSGEIGGRASTSLGIGFIRQLKAPFRILASGGPTFSDGGGPADFHAFAALGIDF